MRRYGSDRCLWPGQSVTATRQATRDAPRDRAGCASAHRRAGRSRSRSDRRGRGRGRGRSLRQCADTRGALAPNQVERGARPPTSTRPGSASVNRPPPTSPTISRICDGSRCPIRSRPRSSRRAITACRLASGTSPTVAELEDMIDRAAAEADHHSTPDRRMVAGVGVGDLDGLPYRLGIRAGVVGLLARALARRFE